MILLVVTFQLSLKQQTRESIISDEKGDEVFGFINSVSQKLKFFKKIMKLDFKRLSNDVSNPTKL